MTRWLASGAGIAGGALVAATVQPPTLAPALVIVGVIVGVLGCLPLLLIITLALVAVFSPHRARRGAAEKILDRLLSVLTRPRHQ
ncbi:MAG TPA: hypothetical protein VIY28_18240 [Pseudonocardiaceae bacterium]